MSKVVLITGGSSGLGKAIGIFLKSKGYTVYGTTRDATKYPDFTGFELLSLDVRKQETISSAIAMLLTKEQRIDVLINNAGVGITGAVEEVPEQEIENVFNINFHGPVKMIKAVLPIMREQKDGLIINITSIAGYMGLPFRAYYSASKGALEVLTEGLRMETKQFGIKITNLAPGDYATNIAAGRYHAPYNENSPYAKVYKHSLDLMNDHVNDGGNPTEVAKKVFAIINTQNPKIHYRVGAFMQKFSIVLKKVLPDTLFEKLLANHYKI